MSDYHCFPGLSSDAFLNTTGLLLEKIVDSEMYLFTEKWLRGGISYIAKKYAKANKYMKNYNRKKPSKCITYLVMNYLCGWTMSV